jgi:hypothetical protein
MPLQSLGRLSLSLLQNSQQKSFLSCRVAPLTYSLWHGHVLIDWNYPKCPSSPSRPRCMPRIYPQQSPVVAGKLTRRLTSPNNEDGQRSIKINRCKRKRAHSPDTTGPGTSGRADLEETQVRQVGNTFCIETSTGRTRVHYTPPPRKVI